MPNSRVFVGVLLRKQRMQDAFPVRLQIVGNVTTRLPPQPNTTPIPLPPIWTLASLKPPQIGFESDVRIQTDAIDLPTDLECPPMLHRSSFIMPYHALPDSLWIPLAACGALGPTQQSARSSAPGKTASRNWKHQTNALGLQSQWVLVGVVRWRVSKSHSSARKPMWPTACKISPRFRSEGKFTGLTWFNYKLHSSSDPQHRF